MITIFCDFPKIITSVPGAKLKSKGGHLTLVTYQEAKALINIDAHWSELEAIVNQQKDYFIHHLTLRLRLLKQIRLKIAKNCRFLDQSSF
jgi:hypothetical protein